ncbi:DUF3566 domain-containing protein [Bounagaea algeriensis]
MTASDKPEESDSRPEEDADRSVLMTDAAQGSETAGSAAGEGEADAAEQAGAAPDGTEVPPPWQRAAAADTSPAANTAASTSAGNAAAETSSATGTSGADTSGADTSGTGETSTFADTATTTEQPAVQADGGTASGAVHDQETVRTQLPQDQQRSALSFDTAAARDTGAARGAGTAADAEAASSSASSASSARRPSRGPRRASLQVKRVDPWSVLKLALVLSVAVFIVWMIAVAVLYGVLDGMGVWDNLNSGISDLTQTDNTLSDPLISAGSVFGVALIIGAINIVLITALATVGAFIYNVAADFAGGLEVTLSERE